jgi:hypothetical protein
MATTLKFYTDSGLTTELTGNLIINQNQDGSTGDVDGVLYLGSVASSKTFQADSNPGVDQIAVSIADSNVAIGTSPETTDIKLATSNGGLTAAVAGDPLNLGLTLTSGVGNQVEVHYRMITPTAPIGTFTELSLNTNTVRET